MSPSNAPSHLTLSFACGSPLDETEGGRQFLQERLSFCARMVFALAFGFYLLSNISFALAGQQSWLDSVTLGSNIALLGACCVLGGMWGLSSRGKRSQPFLRAVDFGGTFLACFLYSLVSLHCKEFVRPEYQTVLGTFSTLVARAMFVPTRPVHTLWLGVASSAPSVIVSYFIMSRPGALVEGVSPGLPTTIIFLWCAVAVVVSTVTSKVVYGLRQEVREAKRLGQYTIEERIGSGGMGAVYKARHAMLRRPTAIKLLRCDVAGEKAIARFEREVQLTSRLTHPNTIAVYDYGRTPDGVFYYAMEYLPGITLDDLVSQYGPQTPGRVISIWRQVLASLSEAHSMGLIHRDIKGANVMLCRRGGMHDVAKVLDFGLAKDLENWTDLNLSAANTITGTPLYLPPEAIQKPESVDARSDIYSVGVVAYQLLTGKPLFEGQNFVEICGHHLHTRPIPPSARTTSPVPRDLEALVLMCLEKDPGKRPQDTGWLLQALSACESARDWDEEKARAWWVEHEKRVQAEQPAGDPTAAIRALADSTPTVAVENPREAITAL
jgi:hypothetical protein